MHFVPQLQKFSRSTNESLTSPKHITSSQISQSFEEDFHYKHDPHPARERLASHFFPLVLISPPQRSVPFRSVPFPYSARAPSAIWLSASTEAPARNQYSDIGPGKRWRCTPTTVLIKGGLISSARPYPPRWHDWFVDGKRRILEKRLFTAPSACENCGATWWR